MSAAVDDTAYHTMRLDRQGQVLVCHLARPERYNAITGEMFHEFARLQREVDDDDGVRVVVLTGQGRGFCSGLDLDEAEVLVALPTPERIRTQERWAAALAGFRTMATPVIAAVNGPAAGGGMALALAADLRVATPELRMNVAFVRIGLSAADVGLSWMLPRYVGLGLASELMLTGRFVEAEEALRVGLVNAVVPGPELMPRAMAYAAQVIANSPTGIRLSKQALQRNVDAPSIEAALDLENRNQVLTMTTEDMPEALAAFRAKRTPVFRGR